MSTVIEYQYDKINLPFVKLYNLFMFEPISPKTSDLANPD